MIPFNREILTYTGANVNRSQWKWFYMQNGYLQVFLQPTTVPFIAIAPKSVFSEKERAKAERIILQWSADSFSPLLHRR